MENKLYLEWISTVAFELRRPQAEGPYRLTNVLPVMDTMDENTPFS